MARTPVSVPVTLPRMDAPVVDRKTGMVTDEWYRYFESLRERTGGDEDAVDGNAVNVAAVEDKTDAVQQEVTELKSNEIIAGRGLEGGGVISDGVEINAKQDDGWVASTGAGDKVTPYAQYTAVPASAAYVQAEATATRTAVAALSARYVALEEALFGTEALGS